MRAMRGAAIGDHMTAVDLRDGESPEHLLTRFRQAVQRDGILREIKQRRHFIPKSERRRIARAKAARRRRRAKKPAAA
jgi:ribosomal protein S21